MTQKTAFQTRAVVPRCCKQHADPVIHLHCSTNKNV